MKTIKHFMNGNRKKFAVAIALSLLFGIAANSTAFANGKMCTHHPTIDWVLDKTVDNVDFYHSITTCDGKNTVFLKFVNRNNKAVKVTWTETFTTKSNEQKDGFAKKQLTIQPGTTTASDCADTKNRQAIINSSDVDPTSIVEISNFTFKDITVENL